MFTQSFTISIAYTTRITLKGGIRLCAKRRITSKNNHIEDCNCTSCDSRRKCVKYPLSFCDHFFTINIAGLTENLSFQLLKLKGQRVEIEMLSGKHEHGVVCNFGIDFIEIKKKDGTVVLILRDKISKIYIQAENCSNISC